MGHLVQNRVGPLLVCGVGDPGSKDEVFEEGDATGVLHGTGIELGDEQLVVLAEWVADLELLLEEFKAGFGEIEDIFWV